MIQLTRKEMMALAGIRFYGNHNIEVSARKKLNEVRWKTYASDSAQGNSRQY